MVKKRKIKKSVLVAISIVAFFIIYGLAFYAGTYLDNKDRPKVESKEDEEIDNRPLMKQLSSKKKIYMSNEEVENIKVDEIYCDYPKENSKPCRDLGAFQSYTERLKQNKAMGEYRRTYQQKFMQVRKNKDNKKLAQNFENWKKQAKEKINDMKKGRLTENEVYNWILKNK